jgi:1-acyl-sn-glycerol-3-phosphate acyltransferase
MQAQLFRQLKGVCSSTLFAINTSFWCFALLPFSLLKLLPFSQLKDFCTLVMVWMGENWITGNNLNLALFQAVDLQITGLENLTKHNSYLVCANHQCWTDIVLLQRTFNRRIPLLRFFLKQQLLYVPLLGVAWWALDFPFMKRYSAAYLLKHPEKRGKDLETTRKACERFRGKQISVLNFLEGTRFSSIKKLEQNSPYQNLLKPKTGGFAFVLDAMGDQFEKLLDVTLYYPTGAVTLWQLFCGQLPKARLHINQRAIPTELVHGDYQNDEIFRDKMQKWVQTIWQEKDALLEKMRLESQQP